MNVYWIAFVWMGLALAASLISIRIGVSVALVEIVIGAIAGNIPHAGAVLRQTEFTQFLAALGSVMLTFLAGAEVDPVTMRRHWKASIAIGLGSVVLPMVCTAFFLDQILGWSRPAAEIGGIALSTTSVAVVYAVMVETGLNRQELGKLILAACFVTGLGTLLTLGGLFVQDAAAALAVLLATAVAAVALPRCLRWVIRVFGHRVSEPEIKLILAVLLGLGALAVRAGSLAVLPAYVVGVSAAGVFAEDRVPMDRLRSLCFALLTPFFFLRAGTLVSAPALVSGAGVIAVLLGLKLVTKVIGVWPASRAFALPRRESTYVTLLMATGLTFGSIAALFGLNDGYLTQAQYTQVVTVVILSAILPTLLAQRFFQPTRVDREEEEALGAEDLAVVRHPVPDADPARRPGA